MKGLIIILTVLLQERNLRRIRAAPLAGRRSRRLRMRRSKPSTLEETHDRPPYIHPLDARRWRSHDLMPAGFTPRALAQNKKVTIGFSQVTTLEPWRVQFNKDIKTEAEKHPRSSS